MDHIQDLIIIGAGPAGISAAIHAKRFDFNFSILEKGIPGGQARAANLIENYPGMPAIPGTVLMDKFVSQLVSLGISIEKNTINKISKENDNYLLTGDNINYTARSVILATGLEPIRLNLKLENEIYYYPDPSTIDHEGKSVLIIGSGDAAFDEAISFSKKSASVTITIRGDSPKANKRLIELVKRSQIKVKTNIDESELLKTKADLIVACIGKRQNLDILDKSLQITIYDLRFTGIQLVGDILHPDIRHIAPAVGDGVCAVEKIVKEIL